MAIDEWLLDGAVAAAASPGGPQPGASLRFYTWSRPTLSLGHHQRQLSPRWLALARRGELQLVRRPSGGRAVLHAAELTYALIWPQAPVRRREAYRAACAWLQQGFAELGLPLRFGAEPASVDHPSCFATSTAADLVHADGAKRIGSAQLWRRGVLLQHGSILLAPDPRLWRRVLAEPPPRLAPLGLSNDDLIAVLRQAARRHLPIAGADWTAQALSPQDWSAVAGRRARYLVAPRLQLQQRAGPAASNAPNDGAGAAGARVTPPADAPRRR